MRQTYRPLTFFSLSLLIPWLLWFTAAYISHHQPSKTMLYIQTGLSIIGLVSPMLLALWLLRSNPGLRADAANRLLKLGGFPKRYLLCTLLLLPFTLILAQFISLLFGHSMAQFHISGNPSFSSAMVSPWFLLISAAIIEELAWHSYGTDALLSRFSMFTASMIFTVYWALWHLPLAFIQGYYHSQVVAEGALYTANFVFSMIVFVLLSNWLYLKSGRSILIAVLFHLSANLGNEIFATHPDSKIIQTGLLIIFIFWIIIKDKALFFSKP